MDIVNSGETDPLSLPNPTVARYDAANEVTEREPSFATCDSRDTNEELTELKAR